MSSPFLEERWAEKAHEEHPEEESEEELKEKAEKIEEKKALAAYDEILEIRDHSELAKKLVESVQVAALKYLITIDKLTNALASKQTEEDIAEYDKSRRITHNSLISDLDILSRFCHKNGIDNKWRRVVGLERTEVTNWVKRISSRIK